MLRIITGNLGSGKTFYAVNYLKKFAKYDQLYEIMLLNSDVLIVTNIDKLAINHMAYQEFRDQGLMDIKAVEKYMQQHNYKRIVMIIDEAQRFFAGLKDQKEFFFFEYSRHLGMDIFLIVQTVSRLPRGLTELAEYVIEAIPRTAGFMGFRYNVLDPKTGMKYHAVNIQKDPNVFRLYKSFDIAEHEKAKPKAYVRNKYIIGALVIVGCFFFATYGLRYAFTGKLSKPQPIKKIPTAQTTTSYQDEKRKLQEQEKAIKGKGSFQRAIESNGTEEKAKEVIELNPKYAVLPGKIEIIPQGKVKGYIYGNGKTYILYD